MARPSAVDAIASSRCRLLKSSWDARHRVDVALTSVVNDEYRHLGVVEDVVRDGAEDGRADGAAAPRAHDDQVVVGGSGPLEQLGPRVAGGRAGGEGDVFGNERFSLRDELLGRPGQVGVRDRDDVRPGPT